MTGIQSDCRRFADKILDATKLDANMLRLNIAKFDLNEFVIVARNECQRKIMIVTKKFEDNIIIW
jgi:hypothetical protein